MPVPCPPTPIEPIRRRSSAPAKALRAPNVRSPSQAGKRAPAAPIAPDAFRKSRRVGRWLTIAILLSGDKGSSTRSAGAAISTTRIILVAHGKTYYWIGPHERRHAGNALDRNSG